MAVIEESVDGARELELLEVLEEDPSIRQVDAATRMGVAVGTVNWLLKRLAAKGYVRVKRIGRWQWRYLLTPSGIARKARLTQQYVRASMNQYRKTRRQSLALIRQMRESGWQSVLIADDSSNDLVDVFRLTCVEQRFKYVGASHDDGPIPTLRIEGRELKLGMPEDAPEGGNDG